MRWSAANLRLLANYWQGSYLTSLCLRGSTNDAITWCSPGIILPVKLPAQLWGERLPGLADAWVVHGVQDLFQTQVLASTRWRSAATAAVSISSARMTSSATTLTRLCLTSTKPPMTANRCSSPWASRIRKVPSSNVEMIGAWLMSTWNGARPPGKVTAWAGPL